MKAREITARLAACGAAMMEAREEVNTFAALVPLVRQAASARQLLAVSVGHHISAMERLRAQLLSQPNGRAEARPSKRKAKTHD